MWQEIIVGVCVLTAMIFLIRRWLFPAAQKSASCGGCGGCNTVADKCSNDPSSNDPSSNNSPSNHQH